MLSMRCRHERGKPRPHAVRAFMLFRANIDVKGSGLHD